MAERALPAPRSPRSGAAYAGIGSRGAPAATLELIESIAARLARGGWVLRTGLSPGADQAFYRGALAGGGEIELYLPWPGFCAEARRQGEGFRVRELPRPSPAAYALAARFHRAWDGRAWTQLGEGERALLARDVYQVLGAQLDAPAACVVCWTPDGGLDGSDPRGEGTGQALRIAHHYGVPVYNIARPQHAARVLELVAATV
jgi:hypothetical protein